MTTKRNDILIKSRFWQFILAISIIIPIILGLVISQDSLILYLGNAYFYLCAPFLIIGLFAKIFSAGTFDLFHYSWNKWRPKLNRNEEAEEPQLHALSSSIGPWYQYLLIIGAIMLLLAIIFSVLHLLINNELMK